MSDVCLYGYEGSTYTRMARIALALKRIEYDFIEVAAWDGTQKLPEYLGMHPFLKVPVLRHGEFQLYETAAITQYIDEAFKGPALQPSGIKHRARMRQLINLHDNYIQPCWVRVLASQILFNPLYDEAIDQDLVAATWTDAVRGAVALETLLKDRAQEAPDLADIQLAPTVLYFSEIAKGAKIIDEQPAISSWWQWMQSFNTIREIVRPTDWANIAKSGS